MGTNVRKWAPILTASLATSYLLLLQDEGSAIASLVALSILLIVMVGYLRDLPVSSNANRSSLGASLESGALLLVLMFAVALRWPRLASVPPGLGVDEAYQGLQGASLWSGDHVPALPGMAYPMWPVWWLLEGLSTRLFGVTVTAVRLPAAFIGSLSVILVWALTRDLLGQVGGLIAAAWLASSFWHVQFSRFGVAAVMVPFEAVVVGWFLLAPRFQNRTWPVVAAGAVSGSCALGYLAGLFVPVWGAALVFFRAHPSPASYREKTWQRVFLFSAAAAIVAMPFLVRGGMDSGRIHGELSSITKRPLVVLANLVATVQAPHRLWAGYPSGAARLTPVEWLLSLLGLGLLLANRASGAGGRVRWALLLWIPAAFAPELIAGEPHLLRGLGLTPALAVLAGAGASWSYHRWGRTALIVIGVAMMLDGVWTGVKLYGPFPHDARIKSAYDAPIEEAARSIKGLLRDGPLSLSPFPDYTSAPTATYLLWNEIHSGALRPSTTQQAFNRLLLAFRNPDGNYPVLFLCGSSAWPRRRDLALVNIEGALGPGNAALSAGRWADAAAYYETFLKTYPESGLAHARLGLALLKLSRWAEARREMESAMSHGIDDPSVTGAVELLKNR